jgi:predicted ATPase
MPIRNQTKPRSALPGSPFLTHVSLKTERIQEGVHPFTLPWLAANLGLTLTTPLTFLVGENGTILSLDGGEIRSVSYQDTDHYRVTKDFLNAPERFYRHLFEEDR